MTIASKFAAAAARIKKLSRGFDAAKSLDFLPIRTEIVELNEETGAIGGSLYAAIEGYDQAQSHSAFELPLLGESLLGLGFKTNLLRSLDIAERNMAALYSATYAGALAVEGISEDEFFADILGAEGPKQSNPFAALLQETEKNRDDLRTLIEALATDRAALLQAARAISAAKNQRESQAEWNDDQNFSFPRDTHGREIIDESELEK